MSSPPVTASSSLADSSPLRARLRKASTSSPSCADSSTQAGELAGLITYTLRGQECEITSLNSVEEGKGIGTALIQAVEDAARAHGCSVLKLTTTNDNLKALGFYQKRGFVLSRLLPDAVTRARALKPEIPLIGYAGIPIRDEIELVKHLGDSRETEAVGTK